MAPSPPLHHVLLFPFPVVGHINPMLQLASSLCTPSYGIQVTLLQTEFRLSQINPDTAANPHLSFYSIPDGLSDAERKDPTNVFAAAGKMAATGVFERVLEDLRQRHNPVTCVISDTFVAWTQFAAEKFGIPRYAFWTSCASSYLIHHYVPDLLARRLLPLKGSDGMLEIPGLQPLPASKLPSILQARDTSDIAFSSFLRLFEADRKCKKLIINSFKDLEPDQLRLLSSDLNSDVVSVGPLLPHGVLSNVRRPTDQRKSSQRHDNRVELMKEDDSCLEWLDSKLPTSVVYVSFGSLASLPEDQLHQLALGLESSNKHFLWVIRGFSEHQGGDGGLPKAFTERTKGQGLLISWAPQLKVLAHPSVGAFLSHCGWNSTIESLSLGVPLIGLPTDFGEQKTIAWLVEQVWHVGIQLHMNDNGCLRGSDVADAVHSVMGHVDGRSAVLRRRAVQLSEAAHRAVLAEGISCRDLTALVEDITENSFPNRFS